MTTMIGQLDAFDLLPPASTLQSGWYPPGTNLLDCKKCKDCLKPIKWSEIRQWHLGRDGSAVSHFWCRTRTTAP